MSCVFLQWTRCFLADNLLYCSHVKAEGDLWWLLIGLEYLHYTNTCVNRADMEHDYKRLLLYFTDQHKEVKTGKSEKFLSIWWVFLRRDVTLFIEGSCWEIWEQLEKLFVLCTLYSALDSWTKMKKVVEYFNSIRIYSCLYFFLQYSVKKYRQLTNS